MPACGCAGSTCSCLVMPGAGIRISGTGTAANPYVIEAAASTISGLLKVTDTPTLDLSLTGVGSVTEPFNLSGVARASMATLTDVNDPGGPTPGDVPIFVAASGPNVAHWEFAPPPTTPPGAVTASTGLQGDGSGGNPLRVRTSGTWGTTPLNVYGADDTLGAPIYTDSTGAVRARPFGFEPVTDGTRPNQYPGRMIIETTSHRLYVSDGTTWTQLGGSTSTIDASQVVSGVLDLARIPDLPATKITSGVFPVARIPDLPASIITSGAFTAAQIPNLNASKITAGIFATARGGTGEANLYSGYNFSTAATGAPRLIATDSNGRLGSVTGALHSSLIPNYLYAQYVTTTAYANEAGSNRFQMWMDSGLNMGRATSSVRVKDQVSDWDVAVEQVLAIPVRRFHRLVDEDGVWDYGGIAEEIDELGLEELIGRDEDGNPMTIKEHLLVWALLGVVQNLAARVSVLEAPKTRRRTSGA